MCDCQNNYLDLSHTKIYTIMAKYTGKIKTGKTYYGKNADSFIDWANATQEELAHAYENSSLDKYITKESKTKTKNESEKANNTKKSSKKADSTKE
tara:strand:- start:407 stop:694 length:288 start_codon:yes stop_codon:yes gene_type:complete